MINEFLRYSLSLELHDSHTICEKQDDSINSICVNKKYRLLIAFDILTVFCPACKIFKQQRQQLTRSCANIFNCVNKLSIFFNFKFISIFFVVYKQKRNSPQRHATSAVKFIKKKEMR